MNSNIEFVYKPSIDNMVKVSRHSKRKNCAQNMFEINPVYGCEFQCQYCGVYSLEGEYYNKVLLYDNYLDYFERYLFDNKDELHKRYFYFSARVDCFQPILINNGLLHGILKLLRKYNGKYFIVTKGKLPPADIQETLIQSRDINQMIISNAMIDEDMRQKLEPGAATIEERFELARFCKENGIVTSASCSPVFPYKNEEYLRPILQRFIDHDINHFFVHFFDGTQYTFDRIIELMPMFEECINEHYYHEESDYNEWDLGYKDIQLKKYLPSSKYSFEAFGRIRKMVKSLDPKGSVSVCSAPHSCVDQAAQFNVEAQDKGFHCVGTRFEK